MFWYLVQSGLLPKSHIFYEEVKAFCYRALSSLLPSNSRFSEEYPALTAWLQSNQFLHGKGSTYFFNGIGGHGQGHLADINMSPSEWIESHNFAGLAPRSITALQSTSHVTNGVQAEDVLRLFASLEGADVVNLRKHGMVGYLVVMASDAMVIKPGLQFCSQVNGVIGLTEPPVLWPETVKELVTKSDADIAEHLKNCKFNSQPLEVHVTSMDDAVSQPVAVYYGGSQGGCQAVDDLHKSLHVLDTCKACIENQENECTYKCTTCWEEKRVCQECAAIGYKEWHPAARPCFTCQTNKAKCKKLLLYFGTGCFLTTVS